MEYQDEDRSYYHGRISREEAVNRLLANGIDGSFLLRMSTTQDGVYTVSVMQNSAVRHLRVMNTDDGGYAFNRDDISASSVWELVQAQMNNTLKSTFDAQDQVALRHPFPTPDASAPIAPDLLMSAGEAGIDAADFGDDVAAFLEGGVDAKSLARQRSVKQPQRAASKPAADTDPFAGLELPSADIGNDGY
eukprot:TRINITY_DN7120_c0_g1_i3.p1 TRINITY_DN7120_c0_g1~~TRINITY_DN7120_c0_g1_i3.p1  ORF type:complete len:199 (+),score=36.52 TRINITY_DN7120_c0_g1_i3:27-599(+)